MTRSARELCESMKEAVSVPIRLHRVACLIILAFCVLCPIWSEADASSRQVTVLYFTDAHQLAPVVDKLGERGGVAKLSTVIQKVRRQEPDAIVAFGGDLAGGSLFGFALRSPAAIRNASATARSLPITGSAAQSRKDFNVSATGRYNAYATASFRGFGTSAKGTSGNHAFNAGRLTG